MGWRIDVMGLIKTKASLTKNFHICPSEVDSMAMWEYELWINALNDQIEEENKDQENEMSKYDTSKYQKMIQNPQKMMPKPSNLNIKMPKL
jgi:hypothetical protein